VEFADLKRLMLQIISKDSNGTLPQLELGNLPLKTKEDLTNLESQIEGKNSFDQLVILRIQI
jgi:hypothetical protein